jgi:hypothetical protein
MSVLACISAAILTEKLFAHNSYMFSARTEKGPVTPRMVRGWIEKLDRSALGDASVNRHDFTTQNNHDLQNKANDMCKRTEGD